MNAATCSCRAEMYRMPGWPPTASMRCMTVVPGSPATSRTPRA